MGKNKLSDTNIELSMGIAPFEHEVACEMESILLKIFEYGDYSFRSALSGEYSQTLNCVYFLAMLNDKIVGVAGCLYSKINPAIAIVGPVGVLSEYRLKGIGTKLLNSIIQHLQQNNCKAAYLGVKDDNPAVKLYTKLDFKRYKGIVRRLLLCGEEELNNFCLGSNTNVNVREAVWGDFPGFQALITEPGYLYSINYPKHIFSSRYVEPERFLSIFPEIMKENKNHGGLLNVLVAGEKENVVGFANISRVPGKTQEHIGELEFFLHDNYIENSFELINITIQEFMNPSIKKILCYCVGCDRIKRDIINLIGGNLIGTLPENVFINGSYEDVLIYEIRGSN